MVLTLASANTHPQSRLRWHDSCNCPGVLLFILWQLPQLEHRRRGCSLRCLCGRRKPHRGQSKRDPTDLRLDSLLSVTYWASWKGRNSSTVFWNDAPRTSSDSTALGNRICISGVGKAFNALFTSALLLELQSMLSASLTVQWTSTCGKTNLMLNLLLNGGYLNYDRLYIYSKTLGQEKYQFFRYWTEALEQFTK